ncbi:peptidoglycan-associated lipoprotein Pal [Salinisphaera aquimarina]|jgi:peptidoglycan-associated lipoprotein|uniref:Peptidoglycan-associated lipoprotein n=1 Tax=Salinisphaera aquimarina TaxID=2094031 RepID=A0ABV7ERI9_9GAMM
MSVFNKILGQRVALMTLLICAMLVLSACGKKNLRDGDNMPVAGMGDNGDQGMGMQSGRDIDVRGLEGIDPDDRSMFMDPNNPLSTRIIYFDLDSSAIPSRFSSAIQASANYLSQHPNTKLRLEGHTDERGTREYNVALGERRAESVQQAFVLSGASASQLSTLSFGEERPAELGSNEAAYSKNRRVEFIYTK